MPINPQLEGNEPCKACLSQPWEFLDELCEEHIQAQRILEELKRPVVFMEDF